MPRMKTFIENNSMLNQLLINNNINLHILSESIPVDISSSHKIIPFEVPQRNELSETVGFEIKGEKESAIYLPDIDSWYNWESNLFELVKSNDLLFIDGTFFNKNEI